MERFHNRPAVQWTTARLAAVEDCAGALLIAGTAAFRDTGFATAERIEQAARRIVVAGGNWTLDRFLARLEWLDSRDPARELVARFRLAAAMRTARVALAARGTRRAQTADEPADVEEGQR
jgi:type IV secretion system protein VirD4